ncbi:heterogeneous nuclear ribonucleoprotein A1-like 2 [Glandiceps talaboti]
MSGSQSQAGLKLFIGGLNRDSTDDALRNHFQQYGNITDCVVVRDNTTKNSRGFGFVTFETVEMVDECQDNKPHVIDGKEVEVKRAIPRDSEDPNAHIKTKKIFVGGCRDAEEEQLRELFASVGKVEHVDVIKDRNTGKKKGFAFVTFENEDRADKAVITRFFSCCNYKIEVKKAAPREAFGGGGGGRGGRGGGGPSRGRGGGGGGRSNYSGGYSDNYNQGQGYSNYGNQGGGGYGGGGYGNQGGGYGGGSGYDSYGDGSYNQGGYGGGGNYGSGGGGGSYGGGSYGTGYGSGGGGGGGGGRGGGRYKPY